MGVRMSIQRDWILSKAMLIMPSSVIFNLLLNMIWKTRNLSVSSADVGLH